MAYMMDNPKKCINRKLKGNNTCIGCYVSQVKNGCFTGSSECFNSGCTHGTCPPERFPNEDTLLKNEYLTSELEKVCRT